MFDIVIHRVLELPDTEFLEIMLENLGGLYKFHGESLLYQTTWVVSTSVSRYCVTDNLGGHHKFHGESLLYQTTWVVSTSVSRYRNRQLGWSPHVSR